MNYICADCGAVFDEERIKVKEHKEDGFVNPYETEYLCPHCESEEIYEAVECELCGKWVPADETTDGICNECVRAIVDAIADVALNRANGYLDSLDAKEVVVDYIKGCM